MSASESSSPSAGATLRATQPEDLVAFTIGSRVRREVNLLIEEIDQWRNGIRVLGVGDALLNSGGWGRALTQKLHYQYEMAVRFSSSASSSATEEVSPGAPSSSPIKLQGGEAKSQNGAASTGRKVLMFLDAYDVIVPDPSEEKILARFDELRRKYPHCEVFFNAEFWCPANCAGAGGAATSARGFTYRNDAGDVNKWDRLPFLNSGVFIGYADTIRAVLEDPEYLGWMLDNESDDQWWWSKVWILDRERGRNRLCLDVHSELLLTTAVAEVGGYVRARTGSFASSSPSRPTLQPVASSAIQPLSARFPKGYQGKMDGYDVVLNPFYNSSSARLENDAAEAAAKSLYSGGLVTRTDTGAHPLVLHFNAGRKGYYRAYEVLRPHSTDIMGSNAELIPLENAPSLILLGGSGFICLRGFLLLLWVVAPFAWCGFARRFVHCVRRAKNFLS
ncbi:unnamed protein product [Amoebophrya sp. A120]|nr:unnamed protein product [Amoebophrya sp. A120]|eukprot:GSA120T00021631001.1